MTQNFAPMGAGDCLDSRNDVVDVRPLHALYGAELLSRPGHAGRAGHAGHADQTAPAVRLRAAGIDAAATATAWAEIATTVADAGTDAGAERGRPDPPALERTG